MRKFLNEKGKYILLGILILSLPFAIIFLPQMNRESAGPVVYSEPNSSNPEYHEPTYRPSDRAKEFFNYSIIWVDYRNPFFKYFYLSLPSLLFLISAFCLRYRARSPRLALTAMFSMMLSVDLILLMQSRVHLLLLVAALAQLISFSFNHKIVRHAFYVLGFILLFSFVYSVLYNNYEILLAYYPSGRYFLQLYEYLALTIQFDFKTTRDLFTPLLIFFIITGIYIPGFIANSIRAGKELFKYTPDLVLPAIVAIWIYLLLVLYPWLYVNTCYYIMDNCYSSNPVFFKIFGNSIDIPFKQIDSIYYDMGLFPKYPFWLGCDPFWIDLSVKLQYLGVYLMIFLSTLINLANIYQGTVQGLSTNYRRRTLGLSLGLLIIVPIHAIMFFITQHL